MLSWAGKYLRRDRTRHDHEPAEMAISPFHDFG
jgi:hypothetical protein